MKDLRKMGSQELDELNKKSLSPAESSRRAELEEVVERGLATFVEVGNALLEIRDSRLYRNTHSTFEKYCRDQWDISKTHANRLINAAGVVANLKRHQVGVMPTHESQVRPLTSLEPEQQRKVWTKAVKECQSLPSRRSVTYPIVRRTRPVEVESDSTETDKVSSPQPNAPGEVRGNGREPIEAPEVQPVDGLTFRDCLTTTLKALDGAEASLRTAFEKWPEQCPEEFGSWLGRIQNLQADVHAELARIRGKDN
jgi:hypothetical protein